MPHFLNYAYMHHRLEVKIHISKGQYWETYTNICFTEIGKVSGCYWSRCLMSEPIASDIGKLKLLTDCTDNTLNGSHIRKSREPNATTFLTNLTIILNANNKIYGLQQFANLRLHKLCTVNKIIITSSDIKTKFLVMNYSYQISPLELINDTLLSLNNLHFKIQLHYLLKLINDTPLNLNNLHFKIPTNHMLVTLPPNFFKFYFFYHPCLSFCIITIIIRASYLVNQHNKWWRLQCYLNSELVSYKSRGSYKPTTIKFKGLSHVFNVSVHLFMRPVCHVIYCVYK